MEASANGIGEMCVCVGGGGGGVGGGQGLQIVNYGRGFINKAKKISPKSVMHKGPLCS